MPASLLHPAPQTRRTATLPIPQAVLTALLVVQTALPAGLLPQAQPSPQMATETMAPAKVTPPHSTASLTSDEKILQVLNRFTYGLRPGDLERIRSIGLNAWFNQQINPSKIDDSALEARLANYPAMQLPSAADGNLPIQQYDPRHINGRGLASPAAKPKKPSTPIRWFAKKTQKNGSDPANS